MWRNPVNPGSAGIPVEVGAVVTGPRLLKSMTVKTA
jgi:hypothetical protein